ncbi:DNA mismatch repair protein MutS [Tamlana fucoidanivorans]|uniref:DNA mismatch repair protein MutS n=1 Tax=Allotamlana fucoidanivorans TaxID=2583814 RepID=A0A5C4SLD7_9FLAO|nr:DNA mismatch repair protein MutS [Tamlana fucoidanivorans]TNJ44220.1 DNA mismatch repair protein MutS [Tamlana fucoidanivorans]
MIHPLNYYEKQLTKHQLQEKTYSKRMIRLSFMRVAFFLLTAYGVYYFFNTWELAVGIAVLGIVVFIYLLSRYTDVKRQKRLHQELVKLNELELKIASGDFFEEPNGLQFQDANHSYSLDVDLFGRGSFFQVINRTAVQEGTQKLAYFLKANKIGNIKQRQEAIKELSSAPEWRQQYTAVARLVNLETSVNQIKSWLNHYQPFLPKVIKWVPLGFSITSVMILVLTVLNIVTNKALLGYLLLLGLGITGIYLKKVNVLALKTDKIRDTFRQYAALLDLIERQTFASDLLIEKQKLIECHGKKASIVFKTFSKHLDALDNRNNLIGAIFGNGLFLNDLRNSFAIEQWIDTYGSKVADWFEVVAFFDAYNTLGNYTFNHPKFVFPEIFENGPIINAEKLGHPMLNEAKRITSDVYIEQSQFFIVTGANMAGKSTFLRTISLHIIMANMGLPVCAASSTYTPMKLITSMRTSDSLTDDSSYFFSELTRLKFIVDAIQEDASYFIVLDEILKGTNSTDKAIGSRKFVEKLVASKATGIIATHDLSLCDIENELKDVKNYYFDAEIINDELFFDFRLKKGVCQNMNASFLLKKMNIV